MNSEKLQFIKMTPTELEIVDIVKKHFSDLTILINNGVFEFKNGKIIINKDNDGHIREIRKEQISWRA